MDNLTVALCNHKAATYAVKHWHYSHSMPIGKLVTYGVWEHGKFIGAVIYGRGANQSLLQPYGLDETRGCELVRVALTQHKAPVSQIVGLSLKNLHRDNPGLRLVVSFADTTQGHHGGIYQAGNWIYTGLTSSSTAWVTRDGKVLHNRAAATNGRGMFFGNRVTMPDRADCTPVKIPGKHRYLYPLDRAMRRQISKLAKPYPAADAPPRESGIDSDPATPPVAGAGATPATRSTIRQEA